MLVKDILMPDNPNNNFRTAELDLSLLSNCFKIQTNWYVITGAPCSGKTTLISKLATKGFLTVPETARHYFIQELDKGRSIDDIRSNGVALERSLTDMQLRIEQGLRTDDFAFLDRGLPESLAYHRVAGLNPNKILSDCFRYRYAAIFLLDRCPVQRDGLRPENEATVAYLDEWIERDYTALGYSVIRIPVMSTEERLALVLENLSNRPST